MKKLTLLLFAITTFAALQAQTITSTTNGNFLMPTTWDCFCVPTPGADIIVAHDVTLNTDWGYTTGSITINNGASLLQDATARSIGINGATATFVNNGTFDIELLLIQPGSFTNNGTASIGSFANFDFFQNTATLNNVDSLFNGGNLINDGDIEVGTFYTTLTMTNNGSITLVDSMVNAGTFSNGNAAIIEADSCTNSGTFTNNGRIDHVEFTNTGTYTNNNFISLVDFTNAGIFDNHDSIVATGSFWNNEDFINHTTGVFTIDVSFLNSDPVNTDASFDNDGEVSVGDSWYNFDAVSGSTGGWFETQDTSFNSGSMVGSFDFCDLTQTAVVAPFLDINLGTVDLSITWCTATEIDEDVINNTLLAYPNPSNGTLHFETGMEEVVYVKLYNLIGKEVYSMQVVRQTTVTDLPAGTYLLTADDEHGNRLSTKKLIIY
jgi:hypothetical protein